jgi:hypothetical protein
MTVSFAEGNLFTSLRSDTSDMPVEDLRRKLQFTGLLLEISPQNAERCEESFGKLQRLI